MAKTTVLIDDLMTVIPQKILDFLQLKTGDRIDFIMEDPEVTARMNALRVMIDRGEKIDIRDLAGLHCKGM